MVDLDVFGCFSLLLLYFFPNLKLIQIFLLSGADKQPPPHSLQKQSQSSPKKIRDRSQAAEKIIGSFPLLDFMQSPKLAPKN